MLDRSARLLSFISNEYPEAFIAPEDGGEAALPQRYTSRPYEYHIQDGKVVLDSLKPEWDNQQG